MVKGQQSSGGSGSSNKEKNSTQTKRSVPHASGDPTFQQNQQTCIFVSKDGTQCRNLTTGYESPRPVGVGSGVATSQPYHTYSDRRLPLPTNQDQFVLTDTDYANRQGAISRASQPLSLQAQSSEQFPNSYTNLQYGSQSTLPSSTAWVPHLDTTSGSWNYSTAVVGDGTSQDMMLVTGVGEGLQEDPFLPVPMAHSHFDDDMLDFAMDTAVDVMADMTRNAGGGVLQEGMEVLDQLDLSVLNDFCGLSSDLNLIDPMSLSPTLVPIQNSELPAPNVPVVVPSDVVLPRDIPALVPPPIVPTATHHGPPGVGGEIGDCLHLMKLMKPLKGKMPSQKCQEEASSQPHTVVSGGYPCTSVATPSADYGCTPAKPVLPSLPLLPPSVPNTPASAIAMTPTPGHPVSATALGLLQCSFVTTSKEHVFEITDAATGMQKSPTMFCGHLFKQLQDLATAKSCNLQVAYDRRAKLPAANLEGKKLRLMIPKDCVPMAQWAKSCKEFKERVLVIQEVVNTLACIHAGAGSGCEPVFFWGCFSVWVGVKGKVYLVPDFLELLQRQQEASTYDYEVNPGEFDLLAVLQLINELITSLSNHQLLSAALTCKLDEIARGRIRHLTQVARVLGERRLCKLDVDCYGQGSVEVYCLEQESLQDGLQPVQKFLPNSSLWVACWADNGMYTYVQSMEMATPDRKMSFGVLPYQGTVSPNDKLVFIRSR